MKVYVITKAKPLEQETYVGIAKSVKEAEKKIRESFPYMRKIDGGYVSDKDCTYLIFLHEEDL